MKNLFILLLVLAVGYAAIFFVSRRLESSSLTSVESFTDEDLYFSSSQLTLVGADFRGLLADWYWIKSLQYLGDKAVLHRDNLNINDLRALNPRLVYPMLDTAAKLDPQFMTLYSYGAAVLPAIDEQQAIKFLKDGIEANPENWRLYHNLGFIYWRAGDFAAAANAYGDGAKKPNAPVWLRQMSLNMQAQGGSRDFARQIYRQMFETAEDEQTKNLAELRYSQLDALDQLDAIRAALQNFNQKNRRCASDWQEIFRDLRLIKANGKNLIFNSQGEPLDPTGEPYSLSNQNGDCSARLSQTSKIPQL